jgi:hypothetical protein
MAKIAQIGAPKKDKHRNQEQIPKINTVLARPRGTTTD